MDFIEDAWRDAATLPDQYIEVRYEDLLTNPSSKISEICHFLGVEFDESMVMLREPSENIGDAVGLSRIMTDNTIKYIDRMSNREVLAIEAIANDVLRYEGYNVEYPISSRRVPKWKMFALQALDGVHLMLFNLRRRSRLKFGVRYWLSAIHLKIRMLGDGVWRKR